MRIVKEGDKRQVICHNCGRSEATYLLRDVDFDDNSGTVKNILAAVCDKCNEVVSIPAQSTPKIKAEYKKTKAPLEVRVPAHYLDVLNIATQKINPELDESFNRYLVLYYIHALSTGHYTQQGLSDLLIADFAKAKASKRLSMRVNASQLAALNSIMSTQHLKKNTDVIKAVILKINEDIVQNKGPEKLSELRNVAAAYV
ncbi:TPA: hypothetical protein OPR08_001957 [Citrobacter koseri]|uniref:hypothetical protein n=1 Tax=Citrobacter koseri TaxID=545 RepID=UPI000D7CDF46|nr:hypothetical protein [Citrobacter koseri]PYZ79200.1 hypothetical protein DNK65_13540 [Citrobacter koseri]RZA55405.1 hypothetical protein EVX99_23090 [Citrobacter koseri]HAT3902001.1 hypothetical protein [Citrobacter koseri]HCB2273802.1 hypothetical protein [Citrobacter koseri]HCR9749754.1 hypothetical protein [Citrobacter koseri]